MRTDGSDGGPAFPYTPAHISDEDPGMSLRDYIATAVLVGMNQWNPNIQSGNLLDDESLKARAEWAYRQADAMLKVRQS